MLVNIDPAALDSDQRYFLTKGLEVIKSHDPTVTELLKELERLSTIEYNDFCRKEGWRYG